MNPKASYSQKRHKIDLERIYKHLCAYEFKLIRMVNDLSPLIADVEENIAELEA